MPEPDGDKKDHRGGAFPKSRRLLRRGEFDLVFQNGRRLKIQGFQLIFRENDLGHPRLGLVVSKRVEPRAVGRNRIKRLVRESFRRRQATLPAVDVVVMARNAAAVADADHLNQQVDRLWYRLERSYRTRSSP